MTGRADQLAKACGGIKFNGEPDEAVIQLIAAAYAFHDAWNWAAELEDLRVYHYELGQALNRFQIKVRAETDGQ